MKISNNTVIKILSVNVVSILLSFIISNQVLSLNTINLDEEIDNNNLQQDVVNQDDISSSNTTLHRGAFSNNTSELFAKVVDMEEQLRELNGRLEKVEHLNSSLTRQLNKLSARLENATSSITKNASNQQSKQSCNQCTNVAKLDHSIHLIKTGQNAESIKLLTNYLQKIKSQKKKSSNEGEIYYWLAKAHMNQKSSDKAVYYFTKSYKYYSNVRLNELLINLINALESGKKYAQICPLLKKLDVKYLNTVSKAKQNKIRILKNRHCKK